MATSSSYDFTVTRDDIIKKAYERIGVIAPNETPHADIISTAALDLNILVKAWMSKGLNLWRKEEATLFLEVGKQVYLLGPTGDQATGEVNEVQSATTGVTTMRIAGIATDTTLEVVSTTGMTVGDTIGILMDDNTVHWSTIDTIPDGDTCSVPSPLDAGSAIGNKVYHYTTGIQRPLRIDSMHRRDSSGIDTPITRVSDDEYQFLSQKGSSGRVNQYYYDPTRDGNGRMHLWSAPDSVKDTVFVNYQRPTQDFDALTDNPDFPAEWFDALILGLAYRLAPGNGIPVQERVLLKADRDEALDDVEAWDEEEASVFFGAETR